uniref:Serine/threonine protein kinase n=1 Tax=Solanum tuberosum TaxID=4113 RepID=M1BHN1_SOLTU
MAYSTTNYSSWKFMYLILTLSLVLGYASSVRTSSTMNSKEEDAYRLFSEPSPRYYDENKVFQKSNLFRMLPKGIPVPPSGPSRRHNGDVDFSNYP